MSTAATGQRNPVLVLGGFFVALGAERWAYYATRTMMLMQLAQRFGMTGAEAAGWIARAQIVLLVAMIGGAFLAWLAGPRVAGVVGCGIALAGYLAMLVAPPHLALLVVSLGAGLFRAAPYAAVAEELALGPGRVSKGVALFAGMYGLSNVAALYSAPMVRGLVTASGFNAVCLASAAALVVATVAAGVTNLAPRVRAEPQPVVRPGSDAALPWRARRRDAEHAIPWLGLVVVGIAAGFAAVAMGATRTVETRLLFHASGRPFVELEKLAYVNPLVVVAVDVVVLAALVVLAASAKRPRAPLVLLVLLGLGGVLLPFTTLPVMLLVVAVAAVGEAIAAPIAHGVMGMSVPTRHTALFGGLFAVFFYGASWVTDPFFYRLTDASPDLANGLAVACSALVVVAGVVVLALSRVLGRGLDP